MVYALALLLAGTTLASTFAHSRQACVVTSHHRADERGGHHHRHESGGDEERPVCCHQAAPLAISWEEGIRSTNAARRAASVLHPSLANTSSIALFGIRGEVGNFYEGPAPPAKIRDHLRLAVLQI